MEPLLQDNALKGKIARLPAKIRDQVCQRLHDGEPGSKILPWLNGLPEVKDLVFEGFQGIPVSNENLSVWRKTGYQDWLRRFERIERTKELSAYAAQAARASGKGFAAGAASIATGKLLELLEAVDEAAADQAEGKKPPGEILISVANALAGLRVTEQNEVRLEQNDKRLSQTDQRIALEREKFQRETVGLTLKALADDRMKTIEASDLPDLEKMERLGQLMFGDSWKPVARGGDGEKKT